MGRLWVCGFEFDVLAKWLYVFPSYPTLFVLATMPSQRLLQPKMGSNLLNPIPYWLAFGPRLNSEVLEMVTPLLASISEQRSPHITDPQPQVKHDVPTVSTAALLVFLRFAGVWCRTKISKSRCVMALHALLDVFLLPAALDQASALLKADGTINFCRVGAAGNGPCCHVDQCDECVDASQRPQYCVAKIFQKTATLSSACATLQAADQHLISLLVNCVADRLGVVATTIQPKVGMLLHGRSKRRRVDEDYKEYVVSEALRLGRGHNANAVVRGDAAADSGIGAKWHEQLCCFEQASAWLTFHDVQDISLAGDASRLGCPAEETEFIAAWSPSVDYGVWLPPQVTTGE